MEPKGIPAFVRQVMTSAKEQPWLTYKTFDSDVWPRDGIEWCYLVSPEISGSNEFEMGLCRLEAGAAHLRHHHPARSEFHYAVSGTATLTIGEERFRAAPQTAFYIPRGVTHSILNDSDETFEFIFCYDVPPNLTRPDTVWDE